VDEKHRVGKRGMQDTHNRRGIVGIGAQSLCNFKVQTCHMEEDIHGTSSVVKL